MKSGISIGFALALLTSAGVQASGINGINGGMPNRISMNVTVAKQTQGATFGEKVNAGLQAAGSAVAQGAALSITIECGSDACRVVLPDGDGYLADIRRQRIEMLKSDVTGDPDATAARRTEVLKSNKTGDPDASAARGIRQGASLLGAALPGGSIVSAAVSSVGNLAGSGGGAAAASYAATGRMAADGKAALATESRTPGVIDVLDPLVDGDYKLTLVIEKASNGLKDTLKTQVRAAAPQRLEITLVLTVQGGVLKTRHDTAMNSIRNLR